MHKRIYMEKEKIGSCLHYAKRKKGLEKTNSLKLCTCTMYKYDWGNKAGNIGLISRN